MVDYTFNRNKGIDYEAPSLKTYRSVTSVPMKSFSLQIAATGNEKIESDDEIEANAYSLWDDVE